MNNLPEICGYIEAPPSKSLMQRAIAAAILANGTSYIHNSSHCYDCLAALDVAGALGAQVVANENEIQITGNFHLYKNQLDCRESALCARLFAPIAALQNQPVEVIGSGSLLCRPMSDTAKILSAFGIKVIGDYKEPLYLPLQWLGPLQPAVATIDASISSQTLSGLLMALPLVNGDSEITVKNLVSRPYIDMTLDVQQAFGVTIEHRNYEQFRIKGGQHYQPQKYTIEGDWSSAAFWLVAAAIHGSVTVSNLQTGSRQADKAIVDILHQAGATVVVDNNLITVRSCDQRPFRFNASDCPDLFPPLVLLASFCHGVSEIEGVNRLLHKESNRALALQETFGILGINIHIENNAMIIYGGEGVHGGKISSFHDHRIAMAAACAGLFTQEPIEIDDRICVDKSYPKFWDDLKKIQQK